MYTPTTIPLNKSHIALMALGSFAFVAGGGWMISRDEYESPFDPTFLWGAGIAAILLFGLIGVFAVIKLFDSQPGLVISEDGFTDNSGVYGKRFIPWETVKRIEVQNVATTKLLLVFITNADELIRQASPFKRVLLRMNHRQSGTPVSLTNKTLDCSLKELHDALLDGLDAYRAKNTDTVQ